MGFPNGIVVDSSGKSGGLALFCIDEVKVELLSYSSGHIDARVRLANAMEAWFWTGFYGNPRTEKRKDLWTLLERLSQNRLDPWICIGDFNEILYQSEKKGQ